MLTKTAEAVKETIFGKPQAESQNKLEVTAQDMTYAQVPVDIFRYFDRETSNTSEVELKRLKDIVTWSRGESCGDKMSALRSLERELGVRHFSESRINRVWNFLKMGNQIDELRKKQESLKGSIYV